MFLLLFLSPLSGGIAASSTTHDEPDVASSFIRQHFDDNKVVITIGRVHKGEQDEWEKRLNAGRRAIEEAAAATVVPVAQPRRTSLQRSKIVQTLSSSSDDHQNGQSGHPRRPRIPKVSSPAEGDQTPPVPKLKRTPRRQRRPSNGSGGGPSGQPDGSVVSSYQPLAVDLDDDAIMV